MKKLFSFVFVLSLLMPFTASASTLTSSQVSAIITLLEAFGVDQGIITTIQTDLNGTSTPQSSTPPIVIYIPSNSSTPDSNNNISISQSAAATIPVSIPTTIGVLTDAVKVYQNVAAQSNTQWQQLVLSNIAVNDSNTKQLYCGERVDLYPVILDQYGNIIGDDFTPVYFTNPETNQISGAVAPYITSGTTWPATGALVGSMEAFDYTPVATSTTEVINYTAGDLTGSFTIETAGISPANCPNQ